MEHALSLAAVLAVSPGVLARHLLRYGGLSAHPSVGEAPSMFELRIADESVRAVVVLLAREEGPCSYLGRRDPSAWTPFVTWHGEKHCTVKRDGLHDF